MTATILYPEQFTSAVEAGQPTPDAVNTIGSFALEAACSAEAMIDPFMERVRNMSPQTLYNLADRTRRQEDASWDPRVKADEWATGAASYFGFASVAHMQAARLAEKSSRYTPEAYEIAQNRLRNQTSEEYFEQVMGYVAEQQRLTYEAILSEAAHANTADAPKTAKNSVSTSSKDTLKPKVTTTREAYVGFVKFIAGDKIAA
jgi:hypothetical protein